MSIKELFSKEAVNAKRQKEIDLIKAFSIIMMIITHCIEELFVYEGHLPSVIIVDVLNRTIGASAFMICMGIGIIFSDMRFLTASVTLLREKKRQGNWYSWSFPAISCSSRV